MPMLSLRKKMEGWQKGLHLPEKVPPHRLDAERLGTPYQTTNIVHPEALGNSTPEPNIPHTRPARGLGERLNSPEALLEVSSTPLASHPESFPCVKTRSTTESLLWKLCGLCVPPGASQGLIPVQRSWCLFMASKGLQSKQIPSQASIRH